MLGYVLIQGTVAIVVAPAIGLSRASLRVQCALLTGGLALTFAAHCIAANASGAAMPPLLAMHLTFTAAAFALAALARLSRSMLDDDLDAIGLMALVAGAVSVGVVSLGDLATIAPSPILEAALLASPLVTAAAAGGFDVFRSGLYSLSPIAHVDVQYPSWQVAATLYWGVALAAAFAASHTRRMRVTASPGQPVQ